MGDRDFSRRGFLRGAGFCGVGALAAVRLPAAPGGVADARIWWNPAAPEGDALFDMPVMQSFKPTKLEVRVGAKRPFGMLHFSDSHLSYMNAQDLVRADKLAHHWYTADFTHFKDAAAGLAAALAYSKAKNLYRLHTGDLVNYVSDANLEWVRRDFDGFPTLYAIGNHDHFVPSRPALKLGDLAAERARLEPKFPNRFACFSQVIEGVNFVAFDDVGTCRDIADSQFAAIKREFEKGLPTVVACHIPFYTPELLDWWLKSNPKLKMEQMSDAYMIGIPGRPSSPFGRRICAYLKTVPNLKAVLCGHLHNEFQSEFRKGVVQYVAGALFKGQAYEIAFS